MTKKKKKLKLNIIKNSNRKLIVLQINNNYSFTLWAIIRIINLKIKR